MPNTLISTTSDSDETTKDLPSFKIFSGTLKAYEKEVDGANRKYLSCTASSTVEDLHGDIMTDDCVMDMAPQAKNKSMTIFLNHSYRWPEDVAGKTTDARVISRATDQDGKKIFDLDLDFEVNEENERAVNTYNAIKNQGIKAGISIGAMISDWAFRDEDQGFWGGLEIKKVDLLEASIVGIPANQRSWVINGLVALGAPKAIVNKALGKEDPKPIEVATNSITIETKDLVIDEGGTAADTNKAVDDAAPEGESPVDSDETGEGEPTESASLEEAAAALDSIKESGADAGLAGIVLGFLEGAVEEIATLRKAYEEIAKERDQLLDDVKSAAEVVETLARTPIGRKAHFTGPVETFRTRFGGYYDDAFLKAIEGADKE